MVNQGHNPSGTARSHDRLPSSSNDYEGNPGSICEHSSILRRRFPVNNFEPDLSKSITEGEARLLVNRIRDHINDARALVLELYEREGWRALGYDSWRECVVAEFDQSQAYLYRLLDAAKVEGIFRPLAKTRLPKAFYDPLQNWNPTSNGKLGRSRQGDSESDRGRGRTSR